MTRQSVGSLQIERTAGTLRGIQVKCTRANKILLRYRGHFDITGTVAAAYELSFYFYLTSL